MKIIFVCHGNICRSPMAEFVMKDMIARKGLSGQFEIASAATSREEIGNPVYPPVRRLLASHGIDSSGKYARLLTVKDYNYNDYIIGMDSENIRNMMRLFKNDKANKIYKLLEFIGDDGDVADPWYTGDFESTWKDVNKGCKALLEHILKN